MEVDRRDLEESRFNVGIFEEDTGGSSTTSPSCNKEKIINNDLTKFATKTGVTESCGWVEKKAETRHERKRGEAFALTESEPPLELELSNFFLLLVRVDLRRGVVQISASGLGLVTVSPPEGRAVATVASSGEARNASKAL